MSATNRTTTTTTASRPCKPINERKITSHSRRLNVPHRAQRVLSNLEGFYPKSGRDLATGHVTKDEAKSKANEGEEGRNGRSEEREEREEGGMMLAIRTNRRAPATSDWRRFGRERRAAELLGQLHGQGRSGEKARSYAYRPKQSHLQWTRSEQQQLTGNAGPSSIRGGDKVVEHNAEGEINPSSQPVTVTRRDSLPAEVEGMSEDVEDEEEDWWRNLPSEEQIISSVALADDSKERSLQDRGASIVTMMTDQEVRASRSDEIDSKEPRTSNTDVKIFGAPPVPLFSARAATERASLTSRQGLKRKDNPLTHFHHDSVGLRTTHYTTSSTGHQVSNRLGPGAPGATWWDTRLQKLRSQACEEESDLFKGIVAYVNGFTGANTTRREVVRLLQMHGAKVVIMPSAKTTHIFTAAFLSASKAHKVLVKRRGGLGPKILHVQWVFDSLATDPPRRQTEHVYSILNPPTRHEEASQPHSLSTGSTSAPMASHGEMRKAVKRVVPATLTTLPHAPDARQGAYKAQRSLADFMGPPAKASTSQVAQLQTSKTIKREQEQQPKSVEKCTSTAAAASDATRNKGRTSQLAECGQRRGGGADELLRGKVRTAEKGAGGSALGAKRAKIQLPAWRMLGK